MSHTCVCVTPGQCDYFHREMSEADYSICGNCLNNPQRAAIVGSWYREKLKQEGATAGCAWKGLPILDEFGNQKFRKTCGCGGMKEKIALFVCHHPQPREAQEDCEKRCGDYLSI